MLSPASQGFAVPFTPASNQQDEQEVGTKYWDMMRHMEEEIQHELQKPIKKTTRELSEPARQTTEQLILKEQQDQILEESHY